MGGFEVALALGGKADFFTRKNEAISAGCGRGLIRLILQVFETGEKNFFLSIRFVLAAALGLKVLEFGAVAVEAAGHALFVEAVEFEAAGLGEEDGGVGDGGLECGIVVGLVFVRIIRSEGEDVHFGGTDAVETPGVPGDGVGELDFGDGLGSEVSDVFVFEFFRRRRGRRQTEW